MYDRQALIEAVEAYFATNLSENQRAKFYWEVLPYACRIARHQLRKSSLVHDYALLEDAGSYAVEKLMVNLDRKDGLYGVWFERPVACVTTFLKSRILDYVRILKNQKRLERRVFGLADTNPGYLDPLEQIEISAKSEAVRRDFSKSIEQLDAVERRVFELRFVLELKPSQIAENTNLEIAQVYSIVARVKSKVRRALKTKVR